MDVAIRHTEGCPNVAKAEARLRSALGSLDGEVPIRLELVSTPDEAQRLEFGGSPSIVVDGRDLFPEPMGEPALACRIYRTEDGPDGAPSVAQLAAALREVGR